MRVVGIVTSGKHQLLKLSHAASGTSSEIRVTKLDPFAPGSDVVVTIEPAAKDVLAIPNPKPTKTPSDQGFVAAPSPVSQVDDYLAVLL